MDYFNRPDVRLALARKWVSRLTQFRLIEDHGERDEAGAVIWHPSATALELIPGARIALTYAGGRDYNETVSNLVLDGLLELDASHHWRPTELATTLLRLPCALAPSDSRMLH
jgi:hypothetical protein